MSNKISLKYVPWGLIDNMSALVQIMARRCPCDTRHYRNQCWPSSPTHIRGTRGRWVNTWRPRQNGRHFADDIFKCILLDENVWISIYISLKFVQIKDIPALVPIMAWRWPGNKPLSKPTVLRLPMHICVTRPHWNNIRCQKLKHLFIEYKILMCHVPCVGTFIQLSIFEHIEALNTVASSHYLNQCWLISSIRSLHAQFSNFTKRSQKSTCICQEQPERWMPKWLMYIGFASCLHWNSCFANFPAKYKNNVEFSEIGFPES